MSVISHGAVAVKAPKGKLNWKLPHNIRPKWRTITSHWRGLPETRSVKARFRAGFRARSSTMVRGVSEGFSKDLEIEGVGFKAAVTSEAESFTRSFHIQSYFQSRKTLKFVVTEKHQAND